VKEEVVFSHCQIMNERKRIWCHKNKRVKRRNRQKKDILHEEFKSQNAGGDHLKVSPNKNFFPRGRFLIPSLLCVHIIIIIVIIAVVVVFVFFFLDVFELPKRDSKKEKPMEMGWGRLMRGSNRVRFQIQNRIGSVQTRVSLTD